MSTLPPYFPTQSLSVTDEQRVVWYYKRFVEVYFQEYRFGHFILAGYASVPALLTPDLLYKIWQNFYGYKWGANQMAIHRIAVADFLLSPLCKEVGVELYEMHHEVRMAFQQWLHAASGSTEWAGRGLKTVADIAAFVQEYHQKPNPGLVRWGEGYTDVQEWGALAFTNHQRVQRQLGLRLLAALNNGREAEAMRLMDIWAKTAAQLEGLYGESGEKDLSNLRDNARLVDAWKALLQQGNKAFLEKLETVTRNLNLLDYNSEGGIEIKVPGAVASQVEEIQTQTVWVLAVGIDKYEAPISPLAGCVHDMEAFTAQLEQTTAQNGQVLRAKKLVNKKATVAAIREGLTAFSKARNGDICVFYFGGHAETRQIEDQKGRELITYDSIVEHRKLTVGQTQSNVDPVTASLSTRKSGVYQAEIEDVIYPVISQKKVQVILVFDTHDVHSAELRAALDQMPHRREPELLEGSLLVLNASGLGEMTYESRNEKGKVSGHFSDAFMRIWSESSTPITWRQLLSMVGRSLKRAKGQNQTPNMEAFPASAGDYFMFSDQRDDTGVITVHYDKDAEAWVVAQPTGVVLQPALPFYPTVVRLRNRPQQTCRVVERGGKLVLADFNAKNKNVPLEVTLVQNAPERIKITFDPAMWEGVRNQLANVLQEVGMPHAVLTDNPSEARFFFYNRGEQFLLRDHLVRPDEDPFSTSENFIFDHDARRFIVQVDHLARWEIISRMGKKMDETGVQLLVEKAEGLDIASLNTSTLPISGEPVAWSGGLPVQIHYRSNTNGQWHAPALRAEVKETPQDRYVHLVVLDTEFGITVFPPYSVSASVLQNVVQQSNIGSQTMSFAPENAPQPWVAFTVSDAALNQGITEKGGYIKVFLADQPLDLGALSQGPLEQVFANYAPGSTQALLLDKELTGFTVPVVVYRQAQEEIANDRPNPAAETPASAPENPSDEQVLASIKHLLKSNQIAESIEHLRDFTNKKSLPQEELLLLNGRLINVKKNVNNGVIARADSEIEFNVIVSGIYSRIGEIANYNQNIDNNIGKEEVENVRDYVAKGDIDKCMELVRAWEYPKISPRLEELLVVTAARWARCVYDFNTGLVSSSEKTTITNTVMRNLLHVVDTLLGKATLFPNEVNLDGDINKVLEGIVTFLKDDNIGYAVSYLMEHTSANGNSQYNEDLNLLRERVIDTEYAEMKHVRTFDREIDIERNKMVSTLVLMAWDIFQVKPTLVPKTVRFSDAEVKNLAERGEWGMLVDELSNVDVVGSEEKTAEEIILLCARWSRLKQRYVIKAIVEYTDYASQTLKLGSRILNVFERLEKKPEPVQSSTPDIQDSGSVPPEDLYQTQSTAPPDTEMPLLPVVAFGSITAEEAPVYSAPAETATLVRTLPYGTRVEIVAENESWFRIQNIEKEMNEVRDLITDNQMGKVFAALEELKINNENIATINAQFFSARRDLEMGTMDQNAYQTAENRLIQELQNEIITLARTPEWVPAASVYKEDPAALA